MSIPFRVEAFVQVTGVYVTSMASVSYATERESANDNAHLLTCRNDRLLVMYCETRIKYPTDRWCFV